LDTIHFSLRIQQLTFGTDQGFLSSDEEGVTGGVLADLSILDDFPKFAEQLPGTLSLGDCVLDLKHINLKH